MSEQVTSTDEQKIRAAELQKERGNQCFAAKDYEKAEEYYTEAIALNPTNHVYYSNRSACYASQNNWEKSEEDAQECIRLNPSFLKGYYRLAIATIEQDKLEEARECLKQGLIVEPNNAQLQKLLNSVKMKQKAAVVALEKQQKRSSIIQPTTTAGARVPLLRDIDESMQREIKELQEQFATTSREHSLVKANIVKCQREQAMNEITKSEVSKLDYDDNAKLYKGIGKMFMLSNKSEILDDLKKNLETERKSEIDLKNKLDYLEKRMKSQQANIQELASSNITE